MIDEVEHLKKRISDLEDAELEVMEAAGEAVATRTGCRTRHGELESARVDEVDARRDAELAVLDAKIADARNDRAGLVPDIPADLMAPVRPAVARHHNGVGAAELRQGRCTGCQLEVNAADLRTIVAASRGRGAALRGVRPDPDPHRAVRARPVSARALIRILTLAVRGVG